MRIEIISVSSIDDGAEVLLTVKFTDGVGEHSSKRKLLLFTDKYLELGLRKGSVIDEETFDMLENASNVCRAIKKGSELLSYSAASKRQLVHKLKKRGFEQDCAQEAAELLEGARVIDERENVRLAVASYMKRLWGRKRIYSELVKKGYDKPAVSEEIGFADPEEFIENCKKLILKKVRAVPSDPVEKNKLVAYLTRYGYSFSEIKEAVSRIFD